MAKKTNITPETEIQELEDEIFDASELCDDDLATFTSDEDEVEFLTTITKGPKKGKKARLILVVNPQNVSATDLAQFRKASAHISLKATCAKKVADAEERRKKAEIAERAQVEGREASEIAAEEEAGISSQVEVDLVETSIDINLELVDLKAILLSKLVVGIKPEIPGRDFSNPENLKAREGIYADAREALDDYFFDSSSEPEEVTGTNETASSATSADGSEATATSDATPPTS